MRDSNFKIDISCSILVTKDLKLLKKMLDVDPLKRISLEEAIDQLQGIMFKKRPSLLKLQMKQPFELGTQTLDEKVFLQSSLG